MTLRLLVADDNAAMRKMIILTFACEDAVIEAVSNGDAAINLLHRFRPNVVMADISMPGYGGYKVCELIRRDPEFADIPVILLFGAFDFQDEEEVKRVKASGCLTKPFDSSEMISLVEKLRTAASRSPVKELSGSKTEQTGTGTEITAEMPAPPTGVAASADTLHAEFRENAETSGGIEKDIEGAARRLSVNHHDGEFSNENPITQPDGSAVREKARAPMSHAAEAACVPDAPESGYRQAPPVETAVPADPPGGEPGENVETCEPDMESVALNRSIHVSPRAWESYLGPDSILEIFNDEMYDAKNAAYRWIPDELVNRVAEKVAEKMLPVIEALIRQTLERTNEVSKELST